MANDDDNAGRILTLEMHDQRRLGLGCENHPCIVRYAGGNEWYRDAGNSRQMAQLRAICNEMDPTRPYHDPKSSWLMNSTHWAISDMLSR